MSFLTGFATGFAKSVDTQLQKSIERTRDNIDMVSKWRLKRAEEREIERRKKDKEIENLIKDAAFVIGGSANDVNAQNIAAALYKERGLSGFTDDINFMKEQKEKSGVRPLDFINRANVDLPANQFSLSDIVRSLSDAESSYAKSDMVFPKGTIKGSGLIKAIAPGFDVTAAGTEQADDQMKDMGLATTPTDTKRDFTRYEFDREGMNYHSMDTNTKLNYLQDIIVNTASTEEDVKKAETRREALLNLSREQGDDKTALKAIDQSLSQMEPLNNDGSKNTEYANLIEDRKRISRKIALQEAQLEGKEAVLRARAEIASQDGNVELATELARRADDMAAGGVTPIEVLISRMNEDIERKLAKHGDAYRNSEGEFDGKGYAEDIAARNREKTKQANLAGATEANVNQAYKLILSNAKNNLSVTNPGLATILESLSAARGSTGTFDSEIVGDVLKTLEEQGENAPELFKQAIKQAGDIYMQQAIEQGWSTDAVRIAMERFGTIDFEAILATTKTEPSLTSSPENTIVSDETVPTDETTAALGQGQQPSVAESDDEITVALRSKFPNTASGAKAFIEKGISKGHDFNTIVSEATQLHGQEFSDNINSMLNVIRNDLESTNAFTRNILAVGESYDLNPVKRRKTAEKMANTLNISADTANALIRQALADKNKPISFSADQATTDNVRLVLDQAGLLTTFGDAVPAQRMDKAVERVAEAFKISEEEARNKIASLSVKEEQPESRSKRDTGKSSNKPVVKDSGTVESSDAPSSVDAPSSDMRLSDPKAMSDAALIARYVTKDLPPPIVAEIKRRLKSKPSFVDQLKAIVDKVEKAKEGSTVSNLDDKTKKKVRSRTNKQRGLMGR
jgi:hypothetical protein